MFKKVNFRKSMFWAFLVFGIIETYKLIRSPFLVHDIVLNQHGLDLGPFELIEVMFPDNFQMLLTLIAFFVIAYFLYVPSAKKAV
jgi:hypothetical protein